VSCQNNWSVIDRACTKSRDYLVYHWITKYDVSNSNSPSLVLFISPISTKHRIGPQSLPSGCLASSHVSADLHRMSWPSDSFSSNQQRLEVKGASMARDQLMKAGFAGWWDKIRSQLMCAHHRTARHVIFCSPQAARKWNCEDGHHAGALLSLCSLHFCQMVQGTYSCAALRSTQGGITECNVWKQKLSQVEPNLAENWSCI